MSIKNCTEGLCSKVSETKITSIESFIKIFRCFSYILKFTFIVSDKM